MEIQLNTIAFWHRWCGSKVRRAITSRIPDSTDRVEWLDADYKELFMPADADGNYVIEKNALHIWPRRSFQWRFPILAEVLR